MKQRRWFYLTLAVMICLSGCVSKEKAISRRIRILEEESNLALKNSNYPLAEQKMQEILRLKPDIEHVRNNLAVLFAEFLNKPDEAIALWQELLKEKPNNSAYLNNIAGMYWRKQDLDKALEYYQKATEHHSSYHMPYYNMAQIYLAKKDFQKAEKMSTKAYELAMKDPNMVALHIRVLLLNSKQDAAVSLIRKIEEESSLLQMQYVTLARILISQKNYSEALSLLTKAADSFPNDALIKTEVIELNIAQNDFSEQVENLVRQLDPEGKANLMPWYEGLYRARKLMAENKPKEALELLHSLAGKIPVQHAYFEGIRIGALAQLMNLEGNSEQVSQLADQAFLLCPERGKILVEQSESAKEDSIQ